MRGRLSEQARVAQRVRSLLATHSPATETSDEGRARLVERRGWSQVEGAGSEPVRPAAGDQPVSPTSGPPAPSTAASAWLHRHGVRINPSRRAVTALGVVVVAVALIAGWWALSGRPREVPVSTASAGVALATVSASGALPAAPSSPPPAGAALGPTPSGAAQDVVIDVVGKVRHPGVYRLPAGSRVDDALRAAGGPLPGVDLSKLNLARRLSDGEQVAVGVPGAVAAATGAGTSSASGEPTSGPVDLNLATLDQLESLPGVGPVLAQHILDWRSAHGRFASVDQLQEVSGIGPSRFADLRARVTV